MIHKLNTKNFLSTSFDDIFKLNYDAVFRIIDDLIIFKNSSKRDAKNLANLKLSEVLREWLNKLKDKVNIFRAFIAMADTISTPVVYTLISPALILINYSRDPSSSSSESDSLRNILKLIFML